MNANSRANLPTSRRNSVAGWVITTTPSSRITDAGEDISTQRALAAPLHSVASILSARDGAPASPAMGTVRQGEAGFTGAAEKPLPRLPSIRHSREEANK
ncbi:MAG: hypothetical protein QOH97_308 [Actinoplanes sp.]|jgi:hypothetical protein|nr:hypothetical protein [Actinoplanes sp.]